ncbi:hypothetical protein HK099_007404 [Clydaea vesicula]|uniref:2'-phosphotransferase n=1 Tax=Clydaea vesicula TaxID=447962 RepID=A0AAD5TWY6_9FUNG|nr:hypothetical protein HK099_007404 [Clydaea vesicula]
MESGQNRSLIQFSKTLSYILRHGAAAENLQIRKDGYLALDELKKLKKLKGKTLDDFKEVVENDNKQRYNLIMENDVWYIRANQGHSITSIEVEMKEIVLPEDLPTVLAMKDGIKFFLSKNNVVLSPGDENGFIGVKYFKSVLKKVGSGFIEILYISGENVKKNALNDEKTEDDKPTSITQLLKRKKKLEKKILEMDSLQKKVESGEIELANLEVNQRAKLENIADVKDKITKLELGIHSIGINLMQHISFSTKFTGEIGKITHPKILITQTLQRQFKL